MKEVNGVKVRSSYVPDEKIPYEKWFRKMKISPTIYLNHPDAKEKANRIMEGVGIELKTNTQIIKEVLLGE